MPCMVAVSTALAKRYIQPATDLERRYLGSGLALGGRQSLYPHREQAKENPRKSIQLPQSALLKFELESESIAGEL